MLWRSHAGKGLVVSGEGSGLSCAKQAFEQRQEGIEGGSPETIWGNILEEDTAGAEVLGQNKLG